MGAVFAKLTGPTASPNTYKQTRTHANGLRMTTRKAVIIRRFKKPPEAVPILRLPATRAAERLPGSY